MTNKLKGFLFRLLFCGFISRRFFPLSWIIFRHQMFVVSSTICFLMSLRSESLLYIDMLVNNWFANLYIFLYILLCGFFWYLTNGFGCSTSGGLLFWRTSCNMSRIKIAKNPIADTSRRKYFSPCLPLFHHIMHLLPIHFQFILHFHIHQ